MNIRCDSENSEIQLGKKLMKESLLSLLTTEAHSCRLYIERLHQAAINFSDAHNNSEFTELINEFSPKLKLFWRRNLEGQNLRPTKHITIKEMAALITKSFQTFEGLATLEFWDDRNMASIGTSLINLSYDYAHELHDLIRSYNEIDIQLPKTFFIHNSFDEEVLTSEQTDLLDKGESGELTPLFFVDEDQLYEAGNDDLGIIKGIEESRQRKYEQYLIAGHEQVAANEYEEALSLFNRAKSFKETAEILTLLGWVYGLQQKIQKAKSFCLQAIQLDPDYGPPYNDLGNFLLNEGQTDEALKWFMLAKKAKEYQNREHPYINSGRAFLAKRDYEKAMEEFSQALILAPYNEELSDTIAKIQNTLDRAKFDNTSSQNEDSAPIF
ncbi:MAG: tetratricopeptide repeat protein [Oligoflexia bacterium]|nr:tetratricopeptide repeat protein [Oligoflexia bacterium]